MVEIDKGVEICDLGLWIPKYSILAFADFHLGYNFSLIEKGIYVPQNQIKDTLERLEKTFRLLNKKPKKIILLGDLKHDFGNLPFEVYREIQRFISFLLKWCEEIILIKGNHDTTVPKYVKIKKFYKFKEFLFCHGDVLPDKTLLKNIKTIIMGHLHPTVTLTDDFVSEKVKVFVKSKYKFKTLIILPAFNLITEGAGFYENVACPFIKNLEGEIWAIPEFNTPLYFGKQSNLIKI
ncbi:MAG: metallophosphoesterase [Candidatus Nanoarchaeia archaeon]